MVDHHVKAQYMYVVFVICKLLQYTISIQDVQYKLYK